LAHLGVPEELPGLEADVFWIGARRALRPRPHAEKALRCDIAGAERDETDD
jgi:hypothetical protein